jgi:hypothetical protein
MTRDHAGTEVYEVVKRDLARRTDKFDAITTFIMSFSSVRAFLEANKNKRWMPGFMVLLFLIGAIIALIIFVVLRVFIVHQRSGF